jgi:two-component system alkaline phosphatase synthesis response regulator PhoP
MAKEKIHVVDDEADILELVGYNLARDGYQVKSALTGEKALAEVADNLPDLILLDLMLPGVDGLDVCRTLKSNSKTSRIPIIMLTAKGEDADVVTGLELGADDYITKPFSPRVLLARVRAVLRRRQTQEDVEDVVVNIHGLSIDPARHEVLLDRKPITLTATEFRLLHFLARRPGWVFTRDQIIGSVKGQDYPVTDRSVDVQIVGLRRKLGEAGRLIETVRGVGYRIRE